MNFIGPILAATIAFGSLVYYIVQAVRSRGGGKATLSKVSPLNGDEAGLQVAKALKQPAGVDALVSLLDDCGDDWDARDFYSNELSGLANLERLHQLNQEAPTATTLLIRGCHYIDAAWRARGNGKADGVSKAAWQKFYDLLGLALADLQASAEAYPDDPTPYGHLLTAGRGLDLGEEEMQHFFDSAIARQPDHYRAHTQMLSDKTPRWGGSLEAMQEFVASRVQDAEVGSPLHMLVLASHLDTWSDLNFKGKPKAAVKFLQDPKVLEEIISAYEVSLGAENSVERKTSVYLHNQAAFMFFMFQQPAMAQPELQKIGKAFTIFPWVWAQYGEETVADTIERAKMTTRAALK